VTTLNLKDGLQRLMSVDVQEGTGIFALSKIIIFKPRFIVKNNTNIDLSYGIAGSIEPTLVYNS
jgi:hypothetical protein